MDNNMDRYLHQMLDNRYEILEIIGTGGMAMVYKARCHRLNRFVAIKILKDEFAADRDFREHFRSESQAVAMLSHPNIVSVYDFSRLGDCQYIVMELLEGITLKQYMEKKGALTWLESSHFATQIAKALSHAHNKGVVHRDIKPQNIMVGIEGGIKVADFGIAHLQNETQAESSETLGSIHYISPEQIRGETVDLRSDLYSLGVVLYEMLTGTLPHVGQSVEEIALKHMNASPEPPHLRNQEIPAKLEEICLKLLSSKLEDRYQNADELLEDLDAFKKEQLIISENAEDAMKKIDDDIYETSISNIRPIDKSMELGRDEYKEKRKRTRKVSTYTGFALIGIFILTIVGFLWEYWISDMFKDNSRIIIPSFVGENSDEIINSRALLGTYSFRIVSVVDPSLPEGYIVSQDPEAEKSIGKTSEKIEVELTVTTGILLTKIPNVVNQDYREGVLALEKLTFKPQIELVVSDTITPDFIVSTNPEAGDEIPAGSTVYIYVSAGPEIKQVEMPNLVGLTQNAAIEKINEAGLELGTITELDDKKNEKGIIFWQSVEAGESVASHTAIYLKVATGPAETTEP